MKLSTGFASGPGEVKGEEEGIRKNGSSWLRGQATI
jgi:hypothetical protein